MPSSDRSSNRSASATNAAKSSLGNSDSKRTFCSVSSNGRSRTSAGSSPKHSFARRVRAESQSLDRLASITSGADTSLAFTMIGSIASGSSLTTSSSASMRSALVNVTSVWWRKRLADLGCTPRDRPRSVSRSDLPAPGSPSTRITLPSRIMSDWPISLSL